MKRDYHHLPVMVAEVLQELRVRPGGRYVDATMGEGGHTEAILTACQPNGEVLGIDLDSSTGEIAKERLATYGEAFRPVAGSYSKIGEICAQEKFLPVHGILFDLGVSSRHLAQPDRGFSFQREGLLDMRFDQNQTLSAADVVNTWSQQELAETLKEYGQEPKSRRIAKAIVDNRPIRTTMELAKVIKEPVKGYGGRINPATKTFQALRIIVNRELENLKEALAQVVDILVLGGRLAIITYHSLEARIVKDFFRLEFRGCICPPEAPECVCGHRPTMKKVTRRAVSPSAEEVKSNPRSRSAKLRVGERI